VHFGLAAKRLIRALTEYLAGEGRRLTLLTALGASEADFRAFKAKLSAFVALCGQDEMSDASAMRIYHALIANVVFFDDATYEHRQTPVALASTGDQQTFVAAGTYLITQRRTEKTKLNKPLDQFQDALARSVSLQISTHAATVLLSTAATRIAKRVSDASVREAQNGVRHDAGLGFAHNIKNLLMPLDSVTDPRPTNRALSRIASLKKDTRLSNYTDDFDLIEGALLSKRQGIAAFSFVKRSASVYYESLSEGDRPRYRPEAQVHDEFVDLVLDLATNIFSGAANVELAGTCFELSGEEKPRRRLLDVQWPVDTMAELAFSDWLLVMLVELALNALKDYALLDLAQQVSLGLLLTLHVAKLSVRERRFEFSQVFVSEAMADRQSARWAKLISEPSSKEFSGLRSVMAMMTQRGWHPTVIRQGVVLTIAWSTMNG